MIKEKRYSEQNNIIVEEIQSLLLNAKKDLFDPKDFATTNFKFDDGTK